MIYDVDYFIKKFSAIPENMWCIEKLRNHLNQRCANGHCGIEQYGHKTNESIALKKIFSVLTITSATEVGLINGETMHGIFLSVKAMDINDGKAREYQQPTPKQRILAALHDIKKLTEPKKERVVYVAVPVSITEQAKELITN